MAEHTVYVCDAGKQTLQLDKKMLKNHKVVVLDDSSTAGGDNENRKVLVGCGVPLKDEFDIHVEIVQTNGSDDEIEKKCVAVGEDEIGEVWVSSPSKANGYFGMDDATQEVFLAKLSNGQDSQSNRTYLRTGDLGFVHNSELFICGRDKDLIIIRGKNHYPKISRLKLIIV